MNKNELKRLGCLVSALSALSAASLTNLGGCFLGYGGTSTTGTTGSTGVGGSVGDLPVVHYECECSCTDQSGHHTVTPYYFCESQPSTAASDCTADCPEFPSGMLGPTCFGTNVDDGTCNGGSDHKSLDSSGHPGSTDATLSRTASTATVTYYGTPTTVLVNGLVEFTGGCASGTCAISFSELGFTVPHLVLTDPLGVQTTLDLVTAVNVGPISGTQVNGTITIPYTALQMLVFGEVDGVTQNPIPFSPTVDVTGSYSPSAGTFSLDADFLSGTQFGLQLTIVSGGMSRPPVADAGAPQSFTIPLGARVEAVTLDGTASSDPDGDLDHIDWYDGATYIGVGSTLVHDFVVGTHTVTAFAFDTADKYSYATTTVTVSH